MVIRCRCVKSFRTIKEDLQGRPIFYTAFSNAGLTVENRGITLNADAGMGYGYALNKIVKKQGHRKNAPMTLLFWNKIRVMTECQAKHIHKPLTRQTKSLLYENRPSWYK